MTTRDPQDSPGVRYIRTMWDQMYGGARGISKRRVDEAMRHATTDAIRFGLKFHENDLDLFVCRELGRLRLDLEGSYALAIEHDNTSWCRAVEKSLGRPPYLVEGVRLREGSSLSWNGMTLNVLNLGTNEIKAALYKSDSSHPKKYFVITREDLRREEQKRKCRERFADLSSALAGRLVLVWSPPTEDDACRDAARADIHLLRTQDEHVATTLLLGRDPWTRTHAALANLAVRMNLTQRFSAEVSHSPEGVRTWHFRLEGKWIEVSLPALPEGFDASAHRQLAATLGTLIDQETFVAATSPDPRAVTLSLLHGMTKRHVGHGWRHVEEVQRDGLRHHLIPKSKARRTVSFCLPNAPEDLTDRVRDAAIEALSELDAEQAEAIQMVALRGADALPPGILVLAAPAPPTLEAAAVSAGFLVLRAEGAASALHTLEALDARLIHRASDNPYRSIHELSNLKFGKLCIRVVGTPERSEEVYDLLFRSHLLPWPEEFRSSDPGNQKRWLEILHEKRPFLMVLVRGEEAEQERAKILEVHPAAMVVRVQPVPDQGLAFRNALYELNQLAAEALRASVGPEEIDPDRRPARRKKTTHG